MMLRRALPVFALVVLSVGAAAAATPKEKAEAHALLSEAKKATKEKRFADAASALKRADEIDSSLQTKLDLAAALASDGKLVEELCQRCNYIERFQEQEKPACANGEADAL